MFAIRIATASSPIAAPDHHAAAGTRWTCTYADPAVAMSPKNRKTESSPSPSDP